MDRKNVRSSNIRSIGYNSESNILEVEFVNGGVYQYFNVPLGKYNALMSASSHGKYLNQYIKGGFRYKQIR